MREKEREREREAGKIMWNQKYREVRERERDGQPDELTVSQTERQTDR